MAFLNNFENFNPGFETFFKGNETFFKNQSMFLTFFKKIETFFKNQTFEKNPGRRPGEGSHSHADIQSGLFGGHFKY